MTTNLHPVADIDSSGENHDEPFAPGDIATGEDDQLVICTPHGNWTVTPDQALRLIRGLSTLMITQEA